METRPVEDVMARLRDLSQLPIVERAHMDTWTVDGRKERVAVVVLTPGIDRIPPSVARSLGDADLGIERIERYSEHVEVVCR